MTVHSPTWEKASARKDRTEPSMVQAAQTAANKHAEYTDHNIHPRDSRILERRELLGVMALNFGQHCRQREENDPSHLLIIDSNSVKQPPCLQRVQERTYRLQL